jgi:hypothetical protein
LDAPEAAPEMMDEAVMGSEKGSNSTLRKSQHTGLLHRSCDLPDHETLASNVLDQVLGSFAVLEVFQGIEELLGPGGT